MRLLTLLAVAAAMCSIVASDAYSQEVSTDCLDFGCVDVNASETEFVEVTIPTAGLDPNGIFVINSVVSERGGFSTSSIFVPGPFAEPEVSIEVGVNFSPVVPGDDSGELTISIPGFDPIFVDLFGTGGSTGDPDVVISSILEFFDESVESETIVGRGSGYKAAKRLRAMRKRIQTVAFLNECGYVHAALFVTKTAIKRSDGEPRPCDFITSPGPYEGSATQQLNDMLIGLECLLAQ